MKHDLLQRYVFPDASVRGEMVQLTDSYKEIVSKSDYPSAVQTLLGEMVAAATLLTATLKFKGEISLQIQSKGLIKYAVVDATDSQGIRGIARWDESATNWPENFADWFQQGVLAITISPEKGERYQGLVALDKPTLAECLEAYFEQSEQLPTCIRLFVETAASQPHAAGILLQVLPTTSASTDAAQHEAFNELAVLTDTMTAEEMQSLDAKTLLHRLYHEHDIELYTPHEVKFHCTCSKERSAQALKNVDKAELLSIVEEEGSLKMDCQYCHTQYVFDAMDIEAIHAGFAENLDNGDGNKPLS